MKKANFHIVKREPMAWYYNLLVRVISIISSLVVCAVVIMLLTKKNPIEIYASMFKGAFGTNLWIWNFLQNLSLIHI